MWLFVDDDGGGWIEEGLRVMRVGFLYLPPALAAGGPALFLSLAPLLSRRATLKKIKERGMHTHIHTHPPPLIGREEKKAICFSFSRAGSGGTAGERGREGRGAERARALASPTLFLFCPPPYAPARSRETKIIGWVFPQTLFVKGFGLATGFWWVKKTEGGRFVGFLGLDRRGVVGKDAGGREGKKRGPQTKKGGRGGGAK